MEKKVYHGVAAERVPSLEEQIRQIVREELAAHEERPVKLDGKKVSEALTEYMTEVRIARGEHPDPFHIPGSRE